jgi:hypothetical protein
MSVGRVSNVSAGYGYSRINLDPKNNKVNPINPRAAQVVLTTPSGENGGANSASGKPAEVAIPLVSPYKMQHSTSGKENSAKFIRVFLGAPPQRRTAKTQKQGPVEEKAKDPLSELNTVADDDFKGINQFETRFNSSSVVNSTNTGADASATPKMQGIAQAIQNLPYFTSFNANANARRVLGL